MNTNTMTQEEARREVERIAETVEYEDAIDEAATLEEAFGASVADYIRRCPYAQEGWAVDYIAILDGVEEMEDIGFDGAAFADKAVEAAKREIARLRDWQIVYVDPDPAAYSEDDDDAPALFAEFVRSRGYKVEWGEPCCLSDAEREVAEQLHEELFQEWLDSLMPEDE